MTQDITTPNLIINILSQEQYDNALNNGDISENELYMITDNSKYAIKDNVYTKQEIDNMLLQIQNIIGVINQKLDEINGEQIS